MKITFLGTGTSQGIPVIHCQCPACVSTDPKDNRLRTSIHIEVNGQNIQIDTGPDFRQQMLRHKIKNIDLILYTHEHSDHVAGIDDIRPYNFKVKKAIKVYGLKRVMDDIKYRFAYIFFNSPYPGAPKIETFEIDKDTTIELSDKRFGPTSIQPIEIKHGNINILGYRFENFAYLTDVKFISAQEIEKLKGLDILVISTLRFKEHNSHVNLEEALAYIKKIGAKKNYLIHLSHDLGPTEEFKKILPDNVEASFDGLVLNI